MITRFGMAPRAHGMSIERFRTHWRTSHADAAGQIPGVLRYTQNHALLDARGHYLLGYPGFDACSELDFESVDAMQAGFASPTYRGLVIADENAFVDKTRFSLVVTDATVVHDGPPGPIKLIRMFRRHPAADRSALPDTLTGPVAERLIEPGTRYVVHVPVEVEFDGPPPAFDAISTIWLPDREALDELLASDRWQAAEWELSGAASGQCVLAAETVEVV